ncbi:MAG: molybdopterin-dependent oxidoreductase [Proteobacteria bacterium]|nr:molybdopterin-dependent oxidoreductase [Pseudomonadota bacterium]
MKQLSLMFDSERCTGCLTCVTACKLIHRLKWRQNRNHIFWAYNGGSGKLEFTHKVCQQCERPACVRACGTNPKALAKREMDGIVVVDKATCTGCQSCVKACPYGVMGFDYRRNVADKCDLCVEFPEMGPNCVRHCVGFALTCGVKEELQEQARKGGRKVRNLDHAGQNPSLIYLEPLKANSQKGKMEVIPYPRLSKSWVSMLTSELSFAFKDSLMPNQGLEDYPFNQEVPPFGADEVLLGGCSMCFNACSALFYIKDGKVINITGNPNDPTTRGRLCSKGLNHVLMYNSRHRLTKALKRIGNRGGGKYVEINYDEAMAEFAGKLKKIRDHYGPESLGIYTPTRSGYLQQRGMAPFFAQAFGTPNFAGSAPLCDTALDIAFSIFQGGRSGNSYLEDDLGSTTFYLIVGENMAETRPVNFGLINDCRLKNGARMVVIDPRQTVTAAKADEWLPIRPGTDMALALAMAYHIISRDLINKGFIEKWVEGFAQVRDFILAKKYTPEWAEPITDIPAEKIKKLAEEFARAERATIFASRGLAQHSNGVQTIRAFMILSAITGHWGKKGVTFQMSSSGKMLGTSLSEADLGKIKPGLSKSPIGWMESIGTGKPYPIKTIIWAGNPFGLWPGLSRLKEGLKNVELIAHLEIWRNDTSYVSDYVFPSAHGVEYGEINRSTEDRRALWIRQMIEPPGDARPDLYFWIELGKRLGLPEILKEGYKDSSVFFDAEMRASFLVKGVTVKRMTESEKGFLRMPLLDERSEEIDTLYLEGSIYPGDKQGRRIPTPSGKLELWTEELEKKFNELGLTALPEFYSEPEQLIDLPYLSQDSADPDRRPSPFWNYSCYAPVVKISKEPKPPREDFDTELITACPPVPHFHSWGNFFWQAWEMWPDLFVHLHPAKARSIGVQTGDRVIVENQRGRIEAVAWIHPGIRESAVYIPIGWGERSPYSQWKSVNWLLPDDQRDPVSDQANTKITLCRVRKA